MKQAKHTRERRRKEASNKSRRGATSGNPAASRQGGRGSVETAVIETLESRQLMSAGVAYGSGGVLYVEGEAKSANVLTVRPTDSGTHLAVGVNGKFTYHKRSQVKSLYLKGGEKRDLMYVDPALTGKVGIKTKTYAGDDTVYAGHGEDYQYGNYGDVVKKAFRGTDAAAAAEAKLKSSASKPAETPAPKAPAKKTAAVKSLSLVEAATGKVLIADLKDGATINLATLPTKKLSIRANLADGAAQSVRFLLNGKVTSTENQSFYALFGNDGSRYNAWTPSLGKHKVAATAYSKDNAKGTAGATRTVTLNVVNAKPSTQPAPQPPPTTSKPPATPKPPAAPVEDNAGGGPDSGKDDAGAFDKPVAVITATYGSSVQLGHAIHVNAMLSTLSVGTKKDATYEWTFGDANGKYNVVRGFNAAHVYTKTGTFTVTLRVTNAAGKVGEARTTVTVTPADRRVIYVSSAGSDNNSGLSASSPIRTWERAKSMVSDDTEILFRRGDTFKVDTGMSIAADNVVIGAYGDAAERPTIKYDGGRDWTAIFSTTAESRNVTIRGLSLDSIYSSQSIWDEDGMPIGVKPGGTNLTVRDSEFLNLGYGINSNAAPSGVLAQDNVAPASDALRGYFAWVEGTDHVLVGNYVKNVHAHVVRVGGNADRLAIAFNDFRNPVESGHAIRGTLTIQMGSHAYVYANKLTDGKVTIGPLGEADGLHEKWARWNWGVFDSNTLDSNLIVEHGAQHIAIRNNVIRHNGGVAIQLEGFNSTYGRGVSDVTVHGNTVLNDETNGTFLQVGGDVRGGIVVTNNLYVAPNLVTGSYNSSGIRTSEDDLGAFTRISGNIWPAAKTLSTADGGIHLIGNEMDPRYYRNPAEWEAFGVVSNDVFRDVTLATTYQVSLGGVTAGSVLKRAA